VTGRRLLPFARAREAVPAAAILLAAALLAVSLCVLTGCGSDGSEYTPTTTSAGPDGPTAGAGEIPAKIAIIAPEKANDFGWNQQGVESARAIAAEIGAELEVADGAGYGDIAPVYRQLADGGAEWVILWASGYNTVGPQLAEETGTKTVVIGAFENGLVPGLSADFETDAQDGAYLAGMVAALMSKSGTIGIVVSADDENWNKMAGGFIVGARAARPDIDIKLAQSGQAAYADAPAGKRVTDSVIAAGADIIFGMGDGSTFGMIQAVENAEPPAGAEKVWFIDVIGDKTSIDDKGVLLTSVVWDYVPVFRRALAQMEAGTYGGEVLSLGLEEGGIRLLPSDDIPAEVWTAVEKAREDIQAGTIEVPVIVRQSELEALLG
jgi:basic membrane protein A and related proteins